uniref:Uncharacterized protein n=1 Tax=Ananas comosus var. bracteatus TaxID=296719 RepID=A0A6V7QYV4_ANACO
MGVSLGPFELELEKEEEFEEERDEEEEVEAEEDLLDEFTVTKLEKDLRWPPKSSSLILPSLVLRTIVGSFLACVVVLLSLRIWPNGFFFEGFMSPFKHSLALDTAYFSSESLDLVKTAFI